MRDRVTAEGRKGVCLVLGVFFFWRFAVVGAAHGRHGPQTRQEPRAAGPRLVISATRADIVVRNGHTCWRPTLKEHTRFIAANDHMIDPPRAVKTDGVFPRRERRTLMP